MSGALTDWAAAYAGVRALVARTTGIQETSILWAGEPEGMRDLPQADLSLRLLPGAGVDELRYTAAAVEGDILVEAVGNRSAVLSVRVRTRDQSPDGRAFWLLERLRNRLTLPSVQSAFGALGFAAVGVLAVVDLGPVRDHRQESEAVLDLAVSYSSSSAPTPADLERATTIRSVELGGAARNGGETITVPDRVITAP